MAFKMKRFSGFFEEETNKQKRKRKKEERKHDKSARKAYREDNPGILNRLLGKYKVK